MTRYPNTALSITVTVTLTFWAAIALTACGGTTVTEDGDIVTVSSGSDSPGTASPAKESTNYDGAITSSHTERGAAVYATYCNGCHSNTSYAPALVGLQRSPAAMRQQIREGSGNMPGMNADRIPAEDLEALLAHLVTLGAVAP